MNALNRLQEVVRRVAADEVMPRFLNVSGRRKADGSMLSDADLAAQQALSAALPDIVSAPVLGEEMPRAEQLALWQHADSGLWVIDPIDGTNNFVNGIPHFALSAAYVQHGRARLGVVFNPAADECFYAEAGGGAFLNGAPLPLRPAAGSLKEAIAGVETKRLRSAGLAARIHTVAPFGTLRCLGSSTLDWCYLAAGRFDIYVHGGQNLWDYAAGALIFEESGGLLATLEGDEFWSGRHAFCRSAVAATDAALFEKWLAWVRANQ